ncbi:MAG TPA: type II toxin-antitoxin system RelE/ParE family toxin [Streptosporangiaceae bacterium]
MSHQLVNQAILVLERNGPAEDRPLVDTITASRIANMKELRPPSSRGSEIRIQLVFYPWRSAVLLVAGDKAGQWDRWYRTAIPTRSSSTTITWQSGERRWAYERCVALAGLWPLGACRGDRWRQGGLRCGGGRDAG